MAARCVPDFVSPPSVAAGTRKTEAIRFLFAVIHAVARK
jgi:hypothetical protein